MRVAEHLARLADRVPGGVIFQGELRQGEPLEAGRPPRAGIDDGLQALERVRSATGLPLLTDGICRISARQRRSLDVLQIPGVLCGRRTCSLPPVAPTGPST